MYAFTFLYPRPKSRMFDYEYHRAVHMPMGLALVKRDLGVEPAMFWIERIDEGDPSSSEQYCAIVHLMFTDREARDRMVTSRINPAAAEKLRSDYDNFTDIAPTIRISQVTMDEDIAGYIDRFEGLG